MVDECVHWPMQLLAESLASSCSNATQFLIIAVLLRDLLCISSFSYSLADFEDRQEKMLYCGYVLPADGGEL